MAGLAERRGPAHDSFWTWREVMYRFLGSLTPDDVESIAAFAYMQMLEAGFTAVGEFHYLHHDIDGRPYADLGEMAERIAAAASATGIGLTLLPTLYIYGGFGGAAPNQGQKRFLNDPDRYATLLARSREIVNALPDARVGIAPHSLRAVTPAAELRMLEYSQRLRRHTRNVLAQEGESTGARIYAEACQGGAQALGREIGAVEAGKRADIVVLDAEHPDVASVETALDAYVFVAGKTLVKDVMVGGEVVVADGRHKRHDAMAARYRKTIKRLSN